MPTLTPSFESIERLGKKAAQTVSQDIKESLLGDIKTLTPEQKQKVFADEQKQQRRLQTMRQNIQVISQQMAEIRKKRRQQGEQKAQVEQKTMPISQEKQKKESVLAKLLKSREGTKEGMQRASG